MSSGFEEGHLLSDDGLIIEALDENGEAILLGQKAAKLLITNLYNTTIPLIRYEFTDQLTIYDRPAVCGSNFRAASLVDGRLDEHFIYAGKTRVHVHLFRHVLEQRLGILEYQVRQTPNGADVDLLIAGNYRVDTNEIKSLLEADLEKLGISNALVRVQIIESIKRTSAQKLKRFFPVQ
ncbi:MAG: hypothetical protein KBT88_06150 [Gammaproteobacteria bacterium]|nr:hypothetical protein [Gammaproteobacteria bacterium]MBQ0839350.1 hypothetical protein [Gammaproteobacteria bacterium]